MKRLYVLDSTLRDGAQSEGISFSVKDKLRIVEALDELGAAYIEAGNPGSNPKDLEFFEAAGKLRLKTARLAAFGSTRRKGIKPEDDANVQSLLASGAQVIVIFGKSWDMHVTEVLKTTLEENISMIKDTVAFFKAKGKEVIYDAEHFFDGCRHNRSYAFTTLKAAAEAGADCVVLCDTNGGSFPEDIYSITDEAVSLLGVPVGIHTHDDGGMAAANTIEAVRAGAVHIQGTLVGIGERCGNANLSTVIPNLQLKRGYECIPNGNIENITEITRRVADICNLPVADNMPYVGKSAFAHKAGMHIDGVTKVSSSFEHVPPATVGNSRRFLMSEVAGRSTIMNKISSLYPDVKKDSAEVQALIDTLKDYEYRGWQFEAAEASFELLVHRKLGSFGNFFDVERFKVIDEQLLKGSGMSASAMIKVAVDGKTEMTAAEGDGPVNALDKALRRALEVFYPSLSDMHLTDYKVRVLDMGSATAAKVRVLIESSDAADYWTTVGVSKDIMEASFIALADSIEYKLIKDSLTKGD